MFSWNPIGYLAKIDFVLFTCRTTFVRKSFFCDVIFRTGLNPDEFHNLS